MLPAAFQGRRVAFVGAHPDDEAFTCGGTLAAIAASGGSADLFVATAGERGRAYVDPSVTTEDLAAQRMRELSCAAELMGIRRVAHLTYPDGSVSEHLDGLETAIVAHLAHWQTEAVIGFGEDGFTGHADHVAIGSVARRAALQLHLPYFAVALPDELADQFRAHLAAKRRHGTYVPHGDTACDLIAVPVDAQRKMEVLRCYASQFDGLDPYRIFPAALADRFMAAEHFEQLA